MYLLNSFSLNMCSSSGLISWRPCAAELDRLLSGPCGPVVNAIGHKTTDDVVCGILAQDGIVVDPGQRRTVSLVPGDRAVVAQYRGPRLPEGATQLPEGAAIDWLLLTVE